MKVISTTLNPHAAAGNSTNTHPIQKVSQNWPNDPKKFLQKYPTRK